MASSSLKSNREISKDTTDVTFDILPFYTCFLTIDFFVEPELSIFVNTVE